MLICQLTDCPCWHECYHATPHELVDDCAITDCGEDGNTSCQPIETQPE